MDNQTKKSTYIQISIALMLLLQLDTVLIQKKQHNFIYCYPGKLSRTFEVVSIEFKENEVNNLMKTMDEALQIYKA